MGSPMKVDPALMAKGKTLVSDASVEVKGTLNKLEGDVEELLAGWKSGGADSFSTAHQAWTQKATTIASALDDLGEKLGVVGVTAGHGDESVSGTFSKFQH